MPYDTLTESGQLEQMRHIKLPITVGYVFGGIVREIGHLRNSKLLNQSVIGVQVRGSNQEQLLSTIPPLLFPVPKNVPLEDATTIIGGADAAYFAIKKSNPQIGEAVLITGASGSVGTYLVQLLHLFHIKTIAIGHSSRHELLKNLGAEQILDYDKPFIEQNISFSSVTKVIDLAGSAPLLDKLTPNLRASKIISLALTNYQPKTKR